MDADLELLEGWRAGDRQAGEALFARHFADIYRFFENKVGSEADELAQRTFLACVAARDQFRSQSTFRTYLFTIARNELYAYFRQARRGDHLDFDEISIAEMATSLSSRIGRIQQAGQLRAALATLPADQQLLLELHYWHELDAEALGEVFAVNPGAVRVRLLRARRALRERLAQTNPPGTADAGGDRLTASLGAPELDLPALADKEI